MNTCLIYVCCVCKIMGVGTVGTHRVHVINNLKVIILFDQSFVHIPYSCEYILHLS